MINNEMEFMARKHIVFMYVILIPFLIPRGFSEVLPIYKTIATMLLYLTIISSFVFMCYCLFKNKLKLPNSLVKMLLYFLIFVLITLGVQGTVNEGLQKLFMAPVLSTVCVLFLNQDRENFIICLSNILIINFSLNLVIFNPYIFSQYFSLNKHLLFLGHVQVASQLGILGLYLSYLLLYVYGLKFKSRILATLSIITMIFSETVASLIAITLIILCYICIKRKHRNKIIDFISKRMLLLFISANVVLFYITLNYDSIKFLGFTSTLNGRLFVWRSVFELLENNWMLGYGAYGVLIETFWHTWTNKEGMNYAHNELIQRLLDGGLVLLIYFLIMLKSYLAKLSEINNKKMKNITSVFVISFLAIMLIESVTEYYYFYIFLSILLYAPEIENDQFVR